MPIADLTTSSVQDLTSLVGRVAVITGGAGGIGYASARRLIEAGARIVLGDIDGCGAETAAQRLGDSTQAVGVAADVSDRASVFALRDEAMRTFGRVDIWINNAGVYPRQLLSSLTVAEWHQVLSINLDGALNGIQAAAEVMRSQGSGVIVNMESTAALRSMGDGLAAYTASKHGLRGLTLSAARELGPDGVRVLGIAPTVVKTDNYVTVARETAGDELGAERRYSEISKLLPLGRPGVPDDIARVVLFCASDLSLFMTGATVLVDGGHLTT